MPEIFYTEEKEWTLNLGDVVVVVWFKVGYKLEDHEYHPGFRSGDTSYVVVKVPVVNEFAVISLECFDSAGDPITGMPHMTPFSDKLTEYILLQEYKLNREFEKYVDTAVIESHKKYKKEGYYEEP